MICTTDGSTRSTASCIDPLKSVICACGTAIAGDDETTANAATTNAIAVNLIEARAARQEVGLLILGSPRVSESGAKGMLGDQ